MRGVSRGRNTLLMVFLMSVTTMLFGQCEYKTGLEKAACQIKTGTVQPNNPINVMESLGPRPPVSSGFEDAIHKETLDPTVDHQPYNPLESLEKTKDGAYILKAGAFEGRLQSYSLDPGVTVPGKDEGFFPAPLKGPKAKLIQQLFTGMDHTPDVQQAQLQALLWSMAGGADYKDLPATQKETAQKLLDPDIAQQLAKSMKAQGLPPAIQRIINRTFAKQQAQLAQAQAKEQQREAQMRAKMQNSKAYKDFADLQSMNTPGSPSVAPVPRGTWTEMPGGYYLRLLPEGYTTTKVQLFVPDDVGALKPTLDITSFIGVSKVPHSVRLAFTTRPAKPVGK